MKNIGIIGIRGYDVVYSGFESFVKRLVDIPNNKNIYYYLFCRDIYQKKHIKRKNFDTVLISTIKDKYFGTILYSFFSDLISLTKPTDIIIYLGLSNSLFAFIHKLFRRRVIVNVDGLDWERKRWNNLGKLYLRICEKLVFLFGDIIVCDSKTVLDYYQKKYHSNKLVYISYGIEARKRKPAEVLKKYHLVPKKYIHTVGRLTPENCTEDLIIAFRQIKTNYKCVIVGDSVYEDKYKDYLLKLAKGDDRIIFTGFLQGREYEELCSSSALYIETKEVGGTHPSLLDAVGFENPIIAKNIGYHKEVLEKHGIYYGNHDDLSKKISHIIKNISRYRKEAKTTKNILLKRYSWKTVIRQYEDLFEKFSA